MRNYTNVKTKMAIMAGVAGLALYSTNAMAVTQNVTANISFDTAITLTKNSDIHFGIVSALNASTYKIDTTGAVTVTAGTGVWLGSSKNAASIKVNGSTVATVDIAVGNYVVNNGVTPSAATCSYNAGGEAACGTLTSQAAPGGGAGKVLLVGVSVAADGSQAAATSAAPTFDVIVTYT